MENLDFVENIEDFVTEFINEIGGQRLEDYLGYKPSYKNADYYFKNENILIELKTFEQDFFSDEDKDSFEKLFDNWVKNDVIKNNDELGKVLSQDKLNANQLKYVQNRVNRYFQERLKDANKQLNTTKEKIGNENTKKVIFICNDGNYFIPHITIVQSINNLINNRNDLNFDFQSYVYFTINQVSYKEGDENNIYRTWIPVFIESKEDSQLNDFINSIGDKFYKFINKKFNIENPFQVIQTDDSEKIKEIKSSIYLPKEKVFKNKNQVDKGEFHPLTSHRNSR